MNGRPEFLVSETEVNRIIDVLLKVHGIDFTGYSRASLTRRIQRIVDRDASGNFGALLERLSVNSNYANLFINEVMVNVTEMFRDPAFFHALRADVLPQLKNLDHITIWHAGCSTGEEVFSMAILLHETDLLKKTRIVATDLNSDAMQKASKGVLTSKMIAEYEANYLSAGGLGLLSDYYAADFNSITVNEFLRSNIQFKQHNLVSDGFFGAFDLIVCRNVLIYFQKPLQSSVVNLFTRSLNKNGYLCLGTKESLLFAEDRFAFDEVDKREKVFRKKGS